MTATPNTTPHTPPARRRPFFTSLTMRAAVMVVLLFAAFTGIAVVVVDRAEAAVVDVERPRLQAATAQFADAVSYGVLARSAALLEAPLLAFRQNADLREVVVTDDQGTVLIEQRVTPDGTHGAGALPDVVIEAPVVTRASAPGDDGDLAAFGIAAGAEQRVGSVRVSYALSGVREVQHRLRVAIFASVAGIGLFALLGAFALASGVVRRLKEIAAAARRVSSGELAVSVTVDGDDNDGGLGGGLGGGFSGDDELAQLGRDFNAMTASLVVQQRRLHEQGQALAERESLAALGRATAVIAHELRNPLGIVLAAAGIVKNEAKPMAARAEAAGLIEDEVRRLERTLADLLAYARPRAAVCVATDVTTTVRQVVARATRPGGPAEHTEVVVVSDAADGVTALVDDGFVHQIVWNLVQNAAQAQATKVTLTIGRSAGLVTISVVDNGPGVPPAARDQLFQPFSTTRQRGTGLGLSASRRMAQDMGGDLRFLAIDDNATDDGLDHGARFVLTLRPGEP
jgi:signal transduction histidine kinase